MYLNKAIIIGNLTRDPEERQLPSGVSVTSFSIATNRVGRIKLVLNKKIPNIICGSIYPC